MIENFTRIHALTAHVDSPFFVCLIICYGWWDLTVYISTKNSIFHTTWNKIKWISCNLLLQQQRKTKRMFISRPRRMKMNTNKNRNNYTHREQEEGEEEEEKSLRAFQLHSLSIYVCSQMFVNKFCVDFRLCEQTTTAMHWQRLIRLILIGELLCKQFFYAHLVLYIPLFRFLCCFVMCDGRFC